MGPRSVLLTAVLCLTGCASQSPLSASMVATRDAVKEYKTCAIEQGYRFIQNKVDPSESLARVAVSQCDRKLKEIEAALTVENQGKTYSEVYIGSYLRATREKAISDTTAALMAVRAGAL